MRFRVALFLIAFLVPTVSSAAVRITEIAWMGVAGTNGQFGEWIELYNDGAEVDLSGWKLYVDGGGELLFSLTKTIPANGYLLVERTTSSMLDPVPGVFDESGSFGGGGLSNAGEHLVLKDTNGTDVDTLNFLSGWPAGDVTTKETMQRSGATWVTASATPKAATTSTTVTTQSGTQTTTTSTVGAIDSTTTKKKTPVRYDPFIKLDTPSELYQYVAHTFDAAIVLEDGQHHTSGIIKWNFGDGTTITQQKLVPVTHRYNYPGTYTLWLGYYKNLFATDPYLSISKTIKVGSPLVSVSVVDGRAIELTNQSGATVDLSNWQVVSNGRSVPLPEHTLIAPDATVVIAGTTLGFDSVSEVTLARPAGEPMISSTRALTNQKVAGATATGGLTAPIAQRTQETVATETVDEDIFTVGDEEKITKSSEMRNRTKKIIFGAIALTVLALFILLERFMAKRE